MANIFRSVMLLVSFCLNPVYAESLEFIDTKAHIDPADSDSKYSLEIMLNEMDRQEELGAPYRHQVKPARAPLS